MTDDNEVRLKTRMDDAFCARMRAAIVAGLESAQIGVVTTPGTQNPNSLGDMEPSPRRFPPPWIAEELDACFIVRDHSQAVHLIVRGKSSLD
jgi:hypothetical protein